jgi:hypothetical protein
MGQWTVFRRQNGEVHDYTPDLTSDAAFSRMMQLSGTNWMVVAKPNGGYRLDMTRTRPVPDLPYADAETVADFWPRIESEHDDRRLAEREIKEDMLFRGRDGVEAHYEPVAGAGIEPVMQRYIDRLVKRGSAGVPLEDQGDLTSTH